jgi:hypothetical protein
VVFMISHNRISYILNQVSTEYGMPSKGILLRERCLPS